MDMMRNRKGQTGKRKVLSDKTAEELFLHYKQHGAVPNYGKQDTSRAKASILWWDGMMTDAEKASHAAPLSCCTHLMLYSSHKSLFCITYTAPKTVPPC